MCPLYFQIRSGAAGPEHHTGPMSHKKVFSWKRLSQKNLKLSKQDQPYKVIFEIDISKAMHLC